MWRLSAREETPVRTNSSSMGPQSIQNQKQNTMTSPSNNSPQDSPQFHTHTFPYPIYALSWSHRKDKPHRLAVGSFLENRNNIIQVVQLDPNGESGGEDSSRRRATAAAATQEKESSSTRRQDASNTSPFNTTHQVSHTYPATKLMFMPDISTNREDLLISSGDGLHVWKLPEEEEEDSTQTQELHCKSRLTTPSTTDAISPPLTSFDWCSQDLSQVGTASIDTMVTIWDIQKEKSKARLIAHEKEVYDIAFKDQHVFGTVGADGSARMFDIRDLHVSTIVHDTDNNVPLLKIAWNKQNPNFFATMEIESSKITIIDVRNMESPYVVCELDNGHSAPVNAIQWAPHSWCHLSSAGDDSQVLIWDLHKIPQPVEEPILSYSAESSVQQLQWSALNPDWVAIASERQLQLLRV